MAGALLVAALPLLVTIAVAIKLDSAGPVIFRQRRLGRYRVPFNVLKFRTMTAGAPSEPHRRYIAQLASDGSGAPVGGLKKLTPDPRVTRVGAVLRKLSLDELPQLVNVLRGEMSLVGPRPALEYELEHYRPEHYERFAVRPGLTGLWQVSGRSRLGFQEMLDLDVQYVRQRSARLDAWILCRTPRALLGHTA
jgi:lipopolysaccharide/colanic/teichoic acid biosynthesis glycosyltransferase